MSDAPDLPVAAPADCPTCHGASTVDPDPDCPTCEGHGEVLPVAAPDHASRHARNVLASTLPAGHKLWKPWALDLADQVLALLVERQQAEERNERLTGKLRERATRDGISAARCLDNLDLDTATYYRGRADAYRAAAVLADEEDAQPEAFPGFRSGLAQAAVEEDARPEQNVAEGMPPDLVRALRDPTIRVPQDDYKLADGRSLWDHLQEWRNAPSDTASAGEEDGR